MWRSIWQLVWDISEWSGVGLGRFAPWVFQQMIGAKRRRIVKGEGSQANIRPDVD